MARLPTPARRAALPLAVLDGLLPLAACAAPGGSTTDDEAAPAAEDSAAPGDDASGAAAAGDVGCGEEPVTICR